MVLRFRAKEVVMAKVNPIPQGYSTVVAYISVKGANDAIAYYKKAFGAEELVRMPMPDGTVGHAELKIGDSIVMLADEMDLSLIHISEPTRLLSTSYAA